MESSAAGSLSLAVSAALAGSLEEIGGQEPFGRARTAIVSINTGQHVPVGIYLLEGDHTILCSRVPFL